MVISRFSLSALVTLLGAWSAAGFLCESEAPSIQYPSVLPPEHSFDCGENLRLSYKDYPGTFRRFPNLTDIPQENYTFFTDNLDFDVVPGSILIGAADKLLLLDSELNVVDTLEWGSLRDREIRCQETYGREGPVRVSYICRNHIRLYRPYPSDPNLLYVCGSQAASDVQQQCRGVSIENGRLEAQPARDTTIPLVAPHPDYNSFGEFSMANENDMSFLALTYTEGMFPFQFLLDIQRIDYNETAEHFNNSEEFDTRRNWFLNPIYFVDLLTPSYSYTEFTPQRPLPAGHNVNYFFFFLREAMQYTLGGQSDEMDENTFTQVVQVCRDDQGVVLQDGTKGFSTLLKTRMYCQDMQPRLNPLGVVNRRYNDLWSVVMNAELGGRADLTKNYERYLYGAFSNHLNGPAGSVICPFKASPTSGNRNGNGGLYDVFKSDVYQSAFDPLISRNRRQFENVFGSCNGRGRLATDVNRVTAEDYVLSESLMSDGGPLIVLEGVYFTQLAVDEVCVVRSQVSRQCLNQDIIFAGTDDGRILKIASFLIGPMEAKGLVAEAISLENGNPVKDLKVETTSEGGKYLFATTNSHVYRLDMERCFRHIGRSACLSSRDPYCVWNSMDGLCQRNNLTALRGETGFVPPYIMQNITSGEFELVGVGFEMSNYTAEEGEMLSITLLSEGGSVSDGVVELVVSNSSGETGVFPVEFNDTTTGTVTIPVPSDSVYTGRASILYLVLRTTDQGGVQFTRGEATVAVNDNDGFVGQIGLLPAQGTKCWPCRILPPPSNDNCSPRTSPNNLPLNAAIREALGSNNDLTITGNGIECVSKQTLLNPALYRFTITFDSSTVDAARLRNNLTVLVGSGQIVKLKEGVEAKVDLLCPTVIPSLDEPLCTTFTNDLATSGLQPGESSSTAADDGAVVALGILFAVAVILCLVLLAILLLVIKKRRGFQRRASSSSVSPQHEKADQHEYNIPDQGNHMTTENAVYEKPDDSSLYENNTRLFTTAETPPTSTDDREGEESEEFIKRDLTASHSSHSSSGSDASPLPVHSAMPLVDPKDSPFQFPTKKGALFTRRDSPKVVLSSSPRTSRGSPKVSVSSMYRPGRASRDSSALNESHADTTTAC